MSDQALQLFSEWGSTGAVIVTVWVMSVKIGKALTRIHERIDAQYSENNRLLAELVAETRRHNGH